MEVLRRAKMIRSTLFGLALLALAGAPRAQVAVENLDQPGAVSIQAVESPVDLAMQATVEKKTATAWVTVARNFSLGEQCPVPEHPDCIHLNAGATIRPVRWTGFTCSGQCTGHCKKNVYLGPGVFRLTVFSCDRTASFHSAAFHLAP
jgi:hypothetical protein